MQARPRQSSSRRSRTSCPTPSVRASRIPTDQGVYCFRCEDESLFIGETDNLRQRIERHFDAGGTHGLPDWLYDSGSRVISLGIVPTPKISPTERKIIELGAIHTFTAVLQLRRRSSGLSVLRRIPPVPIGWPRMDRNPQPLRPPVKWHGGKFYLCHRIIQQFPPHHTYVEPFGGAASVLLNKARSPVEVYNDLDRRITRLFRVLRDHGAELHRRLSLTPYSEVEFQRGRPTRRGRDRAGSTGYRALEAFARRPRGLIQLHAASGPTRHGRCGIRLLSSIDEQLPLIVDRFRTVEIVCRPAVEVIRTWDSPETLIYCDPPYVPSTRHEGSRSIYGYEMSEDDHRELAEVLRQCARERSS